MKMNLVFYISGSNEDICSIYPLKVSFSGYLGIRMNEQTGTFQSESKEFEIQY